MLKKQKIFLVSKSPRRKQLLEEMGFSFEILHTDVEEVYPEHFTPTQIAEYLSQLKLTSVDFSKYAENDIFISCDTIVVLDDMIFGKPETEAEATTMLQQLSGKTHQVISGLTVATKGKTITKHNVTDVTFKSLSEEEIQYYIKHYKPYDKAGGYGIQEWIGLIGVTSIHGCFYNVMGLPTQVLGEMLANF
ncbi:MAG: Maf family nucleotide pyrophosphatase [Bacteroidetes bacterium]|nr:Maf family nucleotide pyrophosphatase [Bacteroidota bacterium]MCL2303618.1 Maf family nucleotide pyrophosphatase [Lentimicrobiaceae bacterium]